jgi:methylthioribose-1-phosphate isomerase
MTYLQIQIALIAAGAALLGTLIAAGAALYTTLLAISAALLGVLLQINSSQTTENKKRIQEVRDDSINKLQDAIVIQFNLFWEMLNLSRELTKENPDNEKVGKLMDEYFSKITYPNINKLKLLAAYGRSLNDDNLNKLLVVSHGE